VQIGQERAGFYSYEEWIVSEVSLEGICPTARFGPWPSLLSQNCEDACRGTGIGAVALLNGSLVARFFLTPSVTDAFIRKHGEEKLTYSMRCIGLLFILLAVYLLSRQ
jgi:hypothetical protein